ncbi:DODA-type extradiol aromatic ring-opening family dioxygenase [Burkholderia cepacia]|uniref:DODA-type extradiol aromatic ring-opening family dioxygenase n=1 Tax=Burkholderia cepacia TaxID=292 RepID=UPI002AB5E051|nr:class III extradiol ring-cleavage dioxygenase [Burkholderia cepacia]
MIYLHYGFPEHLYHMHYQALGSPALAHRVKQLPRGDGIDVRLDRTRGFDHGTFSLMKPLYPEEDMPVAQLSLDKALDPALHLQGGRLLAPLRDEGVLIIGNGRSYHNLCEMLTYRRAESSRRFDDWLQQSLIQSASQERTERRIR